MDNLQKNDIDALLQESKGWICNVTGNEYVYDFHLNSKPIIIKVLSSIRVNDKKEPNKGSYQIRIFAVEKEMIDDKTKIVRGLIRARKVKIAEDWSTEVQNQVMSVINSSKLVYDRIRRKEYACSN
jgi:hypothetical protein